MIEPISLDFEVECPAEHAFRAWTSDITTWWPRDHTVTGADGLTVFLEPGIGGRIFERSGTGEEHDWGRVTAWDPPRLLAYTWHLNRAPDDATDVRIRFLSVSKTRTRVEIEHRGWERLGAGGQAWRDRNGGGWATLLPHFQRYVVGERPEG